MMDLQLIRTFSEVARLGSLTQASKYLHVSPPAISSQIKTFELQLKLILFVRHARGMRLTAAGQRLLPKARRLLTEADNFRNAAMHLHNSPGGAVRLGINCEPGILRVDDLIVSLNHSCPEMELDIEQSTTGQALEQIKENQLDCGFVMGPVPASYSSICLGTMPLVIVAPPEWELFDNDDPDELICQPWIGWNNYCPYDMIMAELLPEARLTIQSNTRTNQSATRQALVEAGLGLSLLELPLADQLARQGRLQIISQEPMPIDINLVWSPKRTQPPQLRVLIAELATLWDVRLADDDLPK